MDEASFFLPDENATERLGAALAACCPAGTVIHLHGDLGAGKSTLVRGFLRSLGYGGSVKSPTYTIVEPYQLHGQRYYHFDLYRLGDAEELEYMGIRDYFDGHAICLLEWPERGSGILPAPDLSLHLVYLDTARHACITPQGEHAEIIVSCINESFSMA